MPGKQAQQTKKSLLERVKNRTTIKNARILAESEFFSNQDYIRTTVPALNVAFSGSIYGGFKPGITMWAGESKRFKTHFSLLMAKSYLDKYEDGCLLFYDSEFGVSPVVFDSFGIDSKRVLHTPVTNLEELKFDIMEQLDEVQRGDHIIIIVDSFGNLASLKEVEDAVDKKSTVDMTRAKQLKSLFRLITPHFIPKNLVFVGINHTYKTMELHSQEVPGGGMGSLYSANSVFVIGRRKDKEGKEMKGYEFIINAYKSRFIREGSQIPVSVAFGDGISVYSGLLDLALESGHVEARKQGRFYRKGGDRAYYRRETNTKDFWMPILKDPTFDAFIRDKYVLPVERIVEPDFADAT